MLESEAEYDDLDVSMNRINTDQPFWNIFGGDVFFFEGQYESYSVFHPSYFCYMGDCIFAKTDIDQCLFLSLYFSTNIGGRLNYVIFLPYDLEGGLTL